MENRLIDDRRELERRQLAAERLLPRHPYVDESVDLVGGRSLVRAPVDGAHVVIGLEETGDELTPACLKPIEALERCRRGEIELASGSPVTFYRHVDCENPQGLRRRPRR